MTTIAQLVPVGTATVRVAFEPALTGEVSETSLAFPFADGGGAGAPLAVRQRNARTGWSSIAFGATPVWPW